jgi:hypothetical protein
MLPRDLEPIVGHELRRLPMPRAPETLLPRVMAAVQAWARRPWYARAWFTWPIGLRAALAAVLIVIAAGVAAIYPLARAAVVELLTKPAADIAGLLAPAVHSIQTAAAAARVLWQVLLEPLALYSFALAAVMCLAGAAVAAAIGRLTMAAR